tara:strand:+ start:60 stop:398 length:339 start_codon:yes stop_codon:yes gene_type:complete
MNNIKINKFIEILTPNLILSYFIVHNIVLVLIGIACSLYLINSNSTNTISNSLSKMLIDIKKEKDNNKNHTTIELKSNKIDLDRGDKSLTLVETIEELGFIPSLNKTDKNAA